MKVILVLKERVFFFHRITEKALRQKPVQNGREKTLKKQCFQGSDLNASKTVVFGNKVFKSTVRICYGLTSTQ
jgi:hypothetical protein